MKAPKRNCIFFCLFPEGVPNLGTIQIKFCTQVVFFFFLMCKLLWIQTQTHMNADFGYMFPGKNFSPLWHSRVYFSFTLTLWLYSFGLPAFCRGSFNWTPHLESALACVSCPPHPVKLPKCKFKVSRSCQGQSWYWHLLMSEDSWFYFISEHGILVWW